MTTTEPTNGSDIPCTGQSLMTQDQESHLQAIKSQFVRDVDRKYRGGAREHGGKLWEMTPLQLIEEGMAEAVDQYTYLFEARRQLLEQAAQRGQPADLVSRA